MDILSLLISFMYRLYDLCLHSSFASQILSFMSLLEVVFVLVPMLLSVAFITVAERKTMASMQRRLGPNIVGYYGLLQAFADALKLLLKEYISPTQANKFLFFLGPVLTLIFSLLGFSVIPYAPGIMISDFNLGILYMLAMSSLSTYGILLSGWSANSKYAFLGSLRSTAQLISYELILSSAILLVILFSGSLSLTVNIEAQKAVWYLIPLFPVFIIFYIGSVAETNRAPFDLVEAESELVSGYMTEHAAVVFVFFFLAEYASILLICILSSMLFLGGYLPLFNLMDLMFNNQTETISSVDSSKWEGKSFKTQNVDLYSAHDELNILEQEIIKRNAFNHSPFSLESKPCKISPDLHTIENNLIKARQNSREQLTNLWIEARQNSPTSNICKGTYINLIWINLEPISAYTSYESFTANPILNGLVHSVRLGLKSSIMVFIFIWTRASYPRIRYDQLMSFCWTILLPLIIAIIILLPCILYSFAILPNNIFLL